MRTRNALMLCLAVLLGLALGSCSGPSGPETSGPALAVEQFYDALNQGDYGRAKAMYSAEARLVIDDPEVTTEDAFREWAEQATRKGTLARVEVVSTEPGEEGQPLQLEIQLVYEDGAKSKHTIPMYEESGEWKLGFIS